MSFKVQTLAEFDPPAYPTVDDGLTPDQRLQWSKQIAEWMDMEITATQPDGEPLPGPHDTNRTPLPQFFNGTITPYDTDQKPVPITWNGFPNMVKVPYPNEPQRWQVADSSRAYQDEYLEWSLKRDDQGNIIVVTFTCEGPEYWDFLAASQPEKLESLYREMNPLFATKMTSTDFWDVHGNYYPLNNWNATTNSGSIAHLVQRNNTLSAEIDIAGQATVIREKNGKIVTDRTVLINCSGYGQPNRNSDPAIGDGVNGLAREGNSVSIANPVAIYMQKFVTSTFRLDVEGTGENMIPVPEKTFRWQRGDISKQMGLRLQVQIPDGVVGTGPNNKGRQLTVSDIVDNSNGQNITYGAQFADYLTLTVKGVAISGGSPAAALPCPGETARLALNAAVTPCNAKVAKRRDGTRW